VEGTSEKVVIAVRELDSKGKSIASSEVVKKALVINPGQIKESIQQEKEKLASLRSQIDAAMVPGLDFSAVESKYNEAASAIQSAESSSDYSRAQDFLTRASAAMEDAQSALTEITIQKTINDADAKVGEVGALITDFRVNKSMEADPRLTPILIAHDNAASLVSAARDSLSAKDYDQARNKASEAAAKAEGSPFRGAQAEGRGRIQSPGSRCICDRWSPLREYRHRRRSGRDRYRGNSGVPLLPWAAEMGRVGIERSIERSILFLAFCA